MTAPVARYNGVAFPDGTRQPSAALTPLTFDYGGSLSLYVGQKRWYNDSGRTLTIGTIRASVGTAPTGASIVCDVDVNGTSIFGTQANRPTIAAGANTATAGAASTTTLTAGQYLTVDIDQIGSTVAGSDLSVTIQLS